MHMVIERCVLRHRTQIPAQDSKTYEGEGVVGLDWRRVDHSL